MITAKLRRSGNSFIVTVPREVVELFNLEAGQTVALEVRPVEIRPALAPDLKEIADDIIQNHAEALRYLAEH